VPDHVHDASAQQIQLLVPSHSRQCSDAFGQPITGGLRSLRRSTQASSDRLPRLPVVDVRIGVTYTAKEIEVELAEGADAGGVRSDIEAALASEAGVLWLTDRRGRQVGIPVAKLAYVEIGAPGDERRIGFAGT
jgi:hypothetical protein